MSYSVNRGASAVFEGRSGSEVGTHDGGSCPCCRGAHSAHVRFEQVRRVPAGEAWVRGYNFVVRKVCTACGFYYLGQE